MKVLSLFSGIGGFDIGLERAGMQTVAFCEFEPYCQAVLKRHWPEVPIYDDVRTLSANTLRRDGVWPIDVIAGGFPCQDLSYAGKRAGIEGERSGLWTEFARLIGEVRPRFAIMENVPGLLSAGHGRVLGDLAALGYDAVWDCIPASAVGAPHRRDRVWIVAYAQHPNTDIAGLHRAAQHVVGDSEPGDKQISEPGPFREVLAHAQSERCGETGRDQSDKPAQWIAGSGEDVANANCEPVRDAGHGSSSGAPGEREASSEKRERVRSDVVAGGDASGTADVAHTDNARLEGRQRGELRKRADERIAGAGGASVRDTSSAGLSDGINGSLGQPGAQPEPERSDWRQPEPRLGRVADGVPHWVDPSEWLEEPEGVPRVATGIENRAARLKALGNSIVPQVAFLIGQAVMESTR